MELTKQERKWIYEAIQRAGFNPAEFTEPSEANDDEVIVIHEPSESYFLIGSKHPHYNSRIVKWKVGDGPHEEANVVHWGVNIESWLAEIKEDIETSDPWAELRALGEEVEGELIDEDGEDDNSPFTHEEQAAIATALDELEGQLQGQLSAPEMRILRRQIFRLRAHDLIGEGATL